MSKLPRKSDGFTLVEVLIAIAIIATLVMLTAPMNRGGSGERARQASCLNNMKQISLALLSYEDEHGTLPPAFTVDEEGNRLHSWRTLLLPYLELQKLYETIDLTKPWDDPANKQARETFLEVYECPSAHSDDGSTTYLAVVGADCVFSEKGSRKTTDVVDGAAETITFLDVAWSRDEHWMSPEDISPKEVLEMFDSHETHHPGVYQAAFLDGHATAISEDVDREALRAMLTIAGGESLEDFDD